MLQLHAVPGSAVEPCATGQKKSLSSSMIDSGRRAFLRGALLTRAGRKAAAVRQQPLGPPPPWHRGWPLQDACQGCANPCVTACEPGIIRLHPADHTLAGTPYLDFEAVSYTHLRAHET